MGKLLDANRERERDLAKELFDGCPDDGNTISEPTRTFDTGATRNNDVGKYDYEGFLSPEALRAYAAYMHENRILEDGTVRDSDNWQKGIPLDVYMKSNWRHFRDLWSSHRGIEVEEGELAAAMGVIFNTFGWAVQRMKADPEWFDRELKKYQEYRAKELAQRRGSS